MLKKEQILIQKQISEIHADHTNILQRIVSIQYKLSKADHSLKSYMLKSYSKSSEQRINEFIRDMSLLIKDMNSMLKIQGIQMHDEQNIECPEPEYEDLGDSEETGLQEQEPEDVVTTTIN